MRNIPHALNKIMRKGKFYMEKNENEDLLLENLESNEQTLALLQFYKKNPLFAYIQIALMAMTDIGIISEEQYEKYMTEAEQNVDVLREYLRKGGNGSSWTTTH